MEKVGKNGVITVDESKTSEDELTISQGLEFDKGYLSPYMVSDQEKMVAELEDAYVLLTDMKISNINDIVPLLQSIVDSHKPLLIIADDLDGDVTSTLVVNKLRGTFNVVAVKAPEFGDAQKAALQDIAILTGAKFYSKDLGMRISIKIAWKKFGEDRSNCLTPISPFSATTTIAPFCSNKVFAISWFKGWSSQSRIYAPCKAG